MFKLSVPLPQPVERIHSEAVASVAVRGPTRRHADQPQQRWVAVEHAGGCLAVTSDTSSAHSCTERELCCNILRTPPYSSFGLNPSDHWQTTASRPHMDQGEHLVTFRIGLLQAYDESRVRDLADGMSLPPLWQVAFPQPGRQRRSARGQMAEALRVDRTNVRIVAVKRSEDGEALVVRLQEVGGKRTRCRLTVAGRRQPVVLQLPAYGLQSVRIDKRGKRHANINHVEEALVDD